MGADERRIQNDIANKQAIAAELQKAQDEGLRREAERQAQEAANLQAELRSRQQQQQRNK